MASVESLKRLFKSLVDLPDNTSARVIGIDPDVDPNYVSTFENLVNAERRKQGKLLIDISPDELGTWKVIVIVES